MLAPKGLINQPSRFGEKSGIFTYFVQISPLAALGRNDAEELFGCYDDEGLLCRNDGVIIRLMKWGNTQRPPITN